MCVVLYQYSVIARQWLAAITSLVLTHFCFSASFNPVYVKMSSRLLYGSDIRQGQRQRTEATVCPINMYKRSLSTADER